MKSSYSKISSFYFCAKKYEYRYVLEVPAPQKAELAFGIALHAALEENFGQKIETRRDLPLDAVLAAFRTALEEGLRAVPEENLRGKTDPHYLRGMGEHFLDRFLKERAPRLQPALKGVECFFSLEVPGKHQVTGKFDLLDDEGVLHDFKTSSKRYDPRKADKTQLVLYAWACESLFGKPPKALCFDVFVKGDGAEGAVELQDPVMFPAPTPSEMSRVAGKLQNQIERIVATQAKDAFTRAFEPLRCHWCEFQPRCTEDWERDGKPAPVRISMDQLL